MNNVVKIEGGKARLTNIELHRRATKAIYEANHIVFENMPGLISQIIENKVWESFEHEDFASYALDATSNGLGVNSNQRLWILRCSLDVHGKHIAEWADVLAKVEEMVRIEFVETGQRTIRSFDSNSLEDLAKNVANVSHADSKITYLPSRQKSTDGALLKLRRSDPEQLSRVVRGEITARKAMVQARKAAGIRTGNESNLVRTQSAFGKMTDEERAEFLEWLAEKLTPEERHKLKELL